MFDAFGFESVIRIAAFIALGLSLTGIGRIYAQHPGFDDWRARTAGTRRRT